jgi:epoxyqueuosine reductase
MEKVWGAESGLGWMGKHSNLLTREQGSWFFIGVVLLDFELEYGCPAKDYCGVCTRCIAACPTGAIVAPHVVDARLCISYLTIELRDSIPRGLRPLIGNRIFGCDDCQEACPWNRFAVDTQVEALRPRPHQRDPELASLVSLTPEEFRVRFAGSAIRRAGRDGLVRNVVVALGNSGRPESVAPLSAAIRDPSPIVRSHAAWALGQIATAEAASVLRAARIGEAEPSVREEIALAEQERHRKQPLPLES